MKLNRLRPHLLATTLLTAAAIAAPAFAEDASTVQAVVVTGSRIPQPNLTSDSPLQTVGQAEAKLEGTTTVENLLNNLPQVVGGQNLGQSINSTGTATVDLRGLGTSRTLVLVDGRRLPPGDAATPVADLNNIPAALVDRVDLVTGGASAVYGADAVAGVVNFIMKHNFQGVQIDVQAGGNQHSNSSSADDALLQAKKIAVPGDKFDGQQYTASAVIGLNAPDDKGNITVFGTYFNSQPVLQSQRDYSACGLASTPNAALVYDSHVCSGSSNSAYGKFIPSANTTPGSITNPATTATGGAFTYHDNTDGTNSFITSAVPAYNFNNKSYLQREDSRYNFGYFAHYKINDSVDIYSDLMFMDDRTQAQYAPSGFFGGTGPIAHNPNFQINCNNPLMSAAQATALCGSAAGTSALALAEIGYRFTSSRRLPT